MSENSGGTDTVGGRWTAALCALLLAGCAIVDRSSRSNFGERPKPSVFVHLGMNASICADKKGESPFTIFVNLFEMGEKAVKVVLNDGQTANLFGDSLTVRGRGGVGEHMATVYVDGWHPQEIHWHVWECTAE